MTQRGRKRKRPQAQAKAPAQIVASDEVQYQKKQYEAFPPAHILQWRYVKPEFRPYRGPKEEFLASRFTFSEDRLRYRWAGMGCDDEIAVIYSDFSLRKRRDQIRLFLDLDIELPDITDPEFQRRLNAVDFVETYELYKQQGQLIRDGLEPDTMETVDPVTGVKRYDRDLRPARARETQARIAARAQLRTELQLLLGQATEISQIQDATGKGILTQIRDVVRNQLSNDQTPMIPLPEGETYEGVLAEVLDGEGNE